MLISHDKRFGTILRGVHLSLMQSRYSALQKQAASSHWYVLCYLQCKVVALLVLFQEESRTVGLRDFVDHLVYIIRGRESDRWQIVGKVIAIVPLSRKIRVARTLHRWRLPLRKLHGIAQGESQCVLSCCHLPFRCSVYGCHHHKEYSRCYYMFLYLHTNAHAISVPNR